MAIHGTRLGSYIGQAAGRAAMAGVGYVVGGVPGAIAGSVSGWPSSQLPNLSSVSGSTASGLGFMTQVQRDTYGMDTGEVVVNADGEIVRARKRRRRRRLLTCGDKADIAFLHGQLGGGQLGRAAISSLLSRRCG